MSLLKRKAAAFGLAFLLATGAMGMTAQAVEIPATVRVGLDSTYKNAGMIQIGSETIAIGTQINGVFLDNAVFRSSGGFLVTPSSGMGVMLADITSYQEALDVAKQITGFGFQAVPGFDGSGYTVYVSGASAEQVRMITGKNAKVLESNSSLMELRSGNQPVAIFSGGAGAQLRSLEEGGTIALGQWKYRGGIEFNRTSSGISAINVVGLEEYLYGVIPSEMPASYELEALKAQAVAARTYAVKRLGSHNGSNYQLCDSIHCQVYKGQSGEADSSTLAVQDTAGKILLYENTVIDAVFSASSGGYTENSENVWQNEFGYLKGKPEINEVGTLEWEKTLTASDLTALLEAKGEGIGTVTDMVISKISSGGRVQELRIVGTSGEKVLTRESIRTYFSGSPSGSLPSKLFTINGRGGVGEAPEVAEGGAVIKDVHISTADGSGKFVIAGRGNGHGCGLSQMGAQGMALLEYSYDEILKYYYTGVTIYPESIQDKRPLRMRNK